LEKNEQKAFAGRALTTSSETAGQSQLSPTPITLKGSATYPGSTILKDLALWLRVLGRSLADLFRPFGHDFSFLRKSQRLVDKRSGEKVAGWWKGQSKKTTGPLEG